MRKEKATATPRRPMEIVHRCPHCGKRTRGIAHYRHVRSCPQGPRERVGAALGYREPNPLQRVAMRLRATVQREVRRQLGALALR